MHNILPFQDLIFFQEIYSYSAISAPSFNACFIFENVSSIKTNIIKVINIPVDAVKLVQIFVQSVTGFTTVEVAIVNGSAKRKVPVGVFGKNRFVLLKPHFAQLDFCSFVRSVQGVANAKVTIEANED